MGKEYAVSVSLGNGNSLDVINFKNMPDEVRSNYKKTVSENIRKGMETSEQASPVPDKSAERAYYQYIKASIKNIGGCIESDIDGERTLSTTTMQSVASLMAFIAAGEKILKNPDEEARKAMNSGSDKVVDYICSQAQKEMSSPELGKFISENILPDPEGLAELLKDPVGYIYSSKLLPDEVAAEQEKKAAEPKLKPGQTPKPGTSRRDDGFYVINWNLMTGEQKSRYSTRCEISASTGAASFYHSRIITSNNLLFEPLYGQLYKDLDKSLKNLQKSISDGGLLSKDTIERLWKTMGRIAATEYLVNHPTNEVEKLREHALEPVTNNQLLKLVGNTQKQIDENTGFTAYFNDKVVSDPEVIREFLSDPLEFVYSKELVPGGRPEKKREEKLNYDNNIVIDTSADNKADIFERNQVATDFEVEPVYERQINIDEWRDKINKCADKLERAKTFVNSSEYRNLITCMKSIGKDNTKLPPELQGKEKFAMELFAIYKATDCYLKHKAKDGVKKNVYGKLAAVEEANKLVEECLQEIGNISFSTPVRDNGKELTSTGEIPISLESQKSMMLEKNPDSPNVRMRGDETYSSIARDYVSSKPDMADMKNEIKETIKNADACMCRIMIHAANNNDPVSFNALESRRTDFLREPFPEVKPEQVKQKVGLEKI